MIRELLAAGCGGALGAMSRYLLSGVVLAGVTWAGFPVGTFAVNALGSLLIGFFMKSVSSSVVMTLLTVGFCGGFTTFSTFSADALKLLRGGDYSTMALYIAMSVAVCMICVSIGMWLGTLLKN